MIQVIREFIDKNTGKFMRVGAIMSNETTQRENELVSKGFAKKLKEEKNEILEEEIKEEVKPKTTKKKVVD